MNFSFLLLPISLFLLGSGSIFLAVELRSIRQELISTKTELSTLKLKYDVLVEKLNESNQSISVLDSIQYNTVSLLDFQTVACVFGVILALSCAGYLSYAMYQNFHNIVYLDDKINKGFDNIINAGTQNTEALTAKVDLISKASSIEVERVISTSLLNKINKSFDIVHENAEKNFLDTNEALIRIINEVSRVTADNVSHNVVVNKAINQIVGSINKLDSSILSLKSAISSNIATAAPAVIDVLSNATT